MEKIKKENLLHGETYLVFAGYDWSENGFDLAEYDKFSDTLTSQSNGADILDKAKIIFILPDTD